MMSQAGGMDVNVLMQRLRRLGMLDTSVFEEVRADASATIPAAVILVASTLLTGLGGWLWYLFADYHPDSGEFFFKSAIGGTVTSLLLWGVWVALVYVLLAQVFRARADINELVRVMGFAAAPLALGILMCIHSLDFGVGVAVLGLFFGANQIAIQSATDAGAGRVLAANGAGFAIWAIILNLLVTTDSTWAPGIFIFAPR